MNKKRWLVGLILLIVAVVIVKDFLAWWHPAAKQPIYWIDPMEPNVHYPGPGKSHMGMELEPVYAQENKQPGVLISDDQASNINVASVPVTQSTLNPTLMSVGTIQPNENNIIAINTYADGWIRNLAVKEVGETVKQGQLLFQLYSPIVVTAQTEFLIALDSHDQNLINGSKKRLLALGMSEQQIDSLNQSRQISQLVNIYAKTDGIVARLTVREGSSITKDTTVMNIINLDDVWMIIEIFESKLSLVHVGQKVKANFPAYPGQVWEGEVAFIYPELDPIAHALKIRLHFKNKQFMLKPNMYANVTLFLNPIVNALSIPTAALIELSNGSHVILDAGDGSYVPQPVATGVEVGERTQILSGLKVGDKVVTDSQFLLDSEANINAGLQRLQDAGNNQ